MALARRLCVACAALTLSPGIGATQALAQGGPVAQPQAQQDRPSRRTPQASPPAVAPLNTTGPASRKPVLTGAAALKARLLAPPVLSSAVRSHYSPPAIIARSTTGECRAQCAETRGQCFSADSVDTSGCDPGWTGCISTCDGLTYSRGP